MTRQALRPAKVPPKLRHRRSAARQELVWLLRVDGHAKEIAMTKQPFAASRGLAPPDPGADELESARTAALARMHPSEIVNDDIAGGAASIEHDDELASLGSGRAGDVTDFQLRINAIGSSLDGGVATFEGEVQIEEYLNNHFISRITILLSVPGTESMAVGEIEARLLDAARDRLQAAGALSPERMETSLRQTRRDEDVAYLSE
jgi:hypothetical protein